MTSRSTGGKILTRQTIGGEILSRQVAKIPAEKFKQDDC